MNLDLEQPMTCFVIVAKDRNGFKRGFEKVAGQRIYLEYHEALDVLRSMDKFTQWRFSVEEAIIGYATARKNERYETTSPKDYE
jgi:hypothetical protein